MLIMTNLTLAADDILTTPNWRLDASASENIPYRFGINTNLLVSESSQPSQKALGKIYNRITASLPENLQGIPIYLIDLRAESHGYLDGNAVSWHIANNLDNYGLSSTAAETNSAQRLKTAVNTDITAYAMGNADTGRGLKAKNWHVQNFSTEQNAATVTGFHYIRIAATDMQAPSDQAINEFLSFCKNLPRNHKYFLHFHCQGGQGRTNSFLALYLMLEHPEMSYTEIMTAVQNLSGLDFDNPDVVGAATVQKLHELYDAVQSGKLGK